MQESATLTITPRGFLLLVHLHNGATYYDRDKYQLNNFVSPTGVINLHVDHAHKFHVRYALHNDI